MVEVFSALITYTYMNLSLANMNPIRLYHNVIIVQKNIVYPWKTTVPPPNAYIYIVFLHLCIIDYALTQFFDTHVKFTSYNFI